MVEFVASRVCAQAPLDATPRPGALSGTDPKANFWTLLRGLAPITVRSANPLCYLPSFVLLFCHVPFPYSYYTLDSSMPHPMDTRPHYPYHVPLTIIANATHFGTLL
jgi:hypothetical protein